MATKSLYSVSYSGGVKPLKDAHSVQQWASKHAGVGSVQVWGFSTSLDAYVWLQTVNL